MTVPHKFNGANAGQLMESILTLVAPDMRGAARVDFQTAIQLAILDAEESAQSETKERDAYKEAVAMNLKLRKALEQSVRVTRMWCAMPHQPGPKDDFDIYFNHSPEMKLVRDTLGKIPEQE